MRVQLDVYLPSAQADSMPSASVLAQGIDAALQVAAHSVQAEVLALLPDE